MHTCVSVQGSVPECALLTRDEISKLQRNVGKKLQEEESDDNEDVEDDYEGGVNYGSSDQDGEEYEIFLL